MSTLFDILAVEWPFIASVLGGVGAVAALIATFPGLFDVWKRRSDSLQVHRITRKTDPDLVGLDELQLSEFGADVADPLGEVRSHVARSRKGRARHQEDTRPYFLAFSLKYQRQVVGYLTAEYFTHSRTIFLWYLLVDKALLPAHEVRQRGSLNLLAEMVRAADGTGVAWEHIITEVEAEPEDIPRARAKLQLFQNAAEELSGRAGRDTVRVFKLPFEYRQPILDLKWLDAPSQHEVREWLLYAPRHLRDDLRVSGNKVEMSKVRAGTLLRTLLLDAYGHAFPEAPKYEAYCARKFAQHTEGLPEFIELLDQGDAVDDGARGAAFHSTPA